MKEVWFYLRLVDNGFGELVVDDEVYYYDTFEDAEERRSKEKIPLTPVMKGYVKA